MKSIILVCVFVLTGYFVSAQDFLNPYENEKYDGVEYAVNLKYIYNNFEWNAYKTDAAFNGYYGEYEIFMRRHVWREFPYSPAVANPYFNVKKTFSIEVVSFPFTVAYTGSGCSMYYGDLVTSEPGCATAHGLYGRTLKMPDVPYDANFKGWANIHPNPLDDAYGFIEGIRRMSPPGDLTIKSVSPPEVFYHDGDRENTLISKIIVEDQRPTFVDRIWYPHTVHKITINLHCTNNDIFSSFSFIQDNTRGRMRFYPFSATNTSTGPSQHDVIFAPELVYDENNHTYDFTDNTFMFPDGGTLNYFPFGEINNSCFGISDPTEYFNYGNQLFYPHPPPFSLHSTFIRSSYGEYFAGYKPDPIDNSLLALREGIKHQYGIDINFNISDLSPDEKLLYNPAEVDIETTDLIFPSGYTFQTVRGVYPTLSEVALSIGVEGNYHDLRDVPIFTDLTDIDYGLTNDNPTRSSRYYIKPNSKLTIEPCVTIYDAVFILQGNGELVFQDRESTYGRFEVFQEDQQGTQSFTDQQVYTANYNLIDKQGMVTRPVSLVPAGNTFLYESNDLIESGTAQQLPANLNLPVTIASETHVVFVAENEIKLTPGFHAAADHSPSGQSVFHALIWPSHCVGSGNRLMASNTNSQNNYIPQKFLYPTNPVLQPNPSRINSRLHFSVLEDSKVSVKLYNAMGQLVNTPLHQNMKEKGNHIVEIKTEGLQPGIYLCTLYTEVDGSKKPMQVSRKLVVE